MYPNLISQFLFTYRLCMQVDGLIRFGVSTEGHILSHHVIYSVCPSTYSIEEWVIKKAISHSWAAMGAAIVTSTMLLRYILVSYEQNRLLFLEKKIYIVVSSWCWTVAFYLYLSIIRFKLWSYMANINYFLPKQCLLFVCKYILT